MSSGQTSPQVSNRVTPVVAHGGFAFVSGQLPRENGALSQTGKVGAEVELDDARRAAAICARNGLDVLLGVFDEADIVRIVKITGFVASAAGFNAQGAVIDAASDVLLDRLGPERGAHARSAVGVAELPHNAPVEVEMIVAVRGGAGSVA
ncbi:hypothetical protein OPKNFCMD_6768 [Methylobacterium crusticola]|uniref:RidA family protein n=1 Tax=Methylobacterium crusticola TaxID=1697972 RepID=A0ABQ4R8H2_9HYPH|nr:RidA family protein [Methylobacterium crusticola]GJD53988.1 hypothetical protein OPKNFCMD_6768 [Methylobacterium crusticola]